jgi:hypothetical protein
MTLALTTRRLLSRSLASATDYREFWPTDLDFMMLQSAGLISGHIGQTGPGDTTKLWLDTSAGLASPGTWKYHNGSSWVTVASTTKVAEHILARGAPGTFLTDGDKGDVVVSASGATWELDPVAAGARLAASSSAVDAIKDAITGALEAADARAMVNAIQADATALADIRSSFPHYMAAGSGVLSGVSGSGASVVMTLDDRIGAWDVSVVGVGSSAGNVNLTFAVSRDNGTSWVSIRTVANSFGSSSMTFRIHAPATGSTVVVAQQGLDWAGATVGAVSSSFTAATDGASNVLCRLSAASGNVTFSKFKAVTIA